MAAFFRRPSDPHAVPPPFPTYLLPVRPFRRRSRHASTESADSVTSNSSVCTTSTDATDPEIDLSSSRTVQFNSASASPFSTPAAPAPAPLKPSPMQTQEPTSRYLSGHSGHISCAKCATHLCLTSQIISKGFTGRHGRAYLISPSPSPFNQRNVPIQTLPNTFLSKAVARNLVTGQHMVCDISCLICGSSLGWKYQEAQEAGQKYKVGKFILETKKIRTGVRWDIEGDPDSDGRDEAEYLDYRPDIGSKGDGKDRLFDRERVLRDDEEEIEFDSQDEDECEDLFAGVWSPALAKRRRQRKSERYRRKAGRVFIPPVGSGRSSLESLG